MEMNVLFARIPVAAYPAAVEWYERFFDRPADIVPNDTEVMWRVADGGWLYVINDSSHPGVTEVTIAVPSLAATLAELTSRDIAGGPIESVGDAAHKAFVTDPEGNKIALIEVAQ